MLRAERHKQIVALVNRKRIAAVEDLMAEVSISRATARRDIDELAAEGLIIKIRGGAQAAEPSGEGTTEPSLVAKGLINLEEKQRIAAAAVARIHTGDKIILDSGTTVLETARALPRGMELTVITNDLRIAMEVSDQSDIDLFFVGGRIRKGYFSSYGYFAEAMLTDVTADKIFLSVDAIDDGFRVTSFTGDDLNLKKIGLSNARERILLCDHSKFSSNALLTVCNMDVIDTIITGAEVGEETAARLRQLGKQVELV